jgi:hypothetical protein
MAKALGKLTRLLNASAPQYPLQLSLPCRQQKDLQTGSPKMITMTPQAPNDYLVEFVDQIAAEELKDKTKSKPALAGGLPLAQGHRLGNDTTSQR